MRRLKSKAVCWLLPLGLVVAPLSASADGDRAIIQEAIADYMLESAHTSGVITQEQFDAEYAKSALVVDTRKEAQFEQAHIPGAIHMEWRETMDRIDEIPKARPVVLYDSTGVLAAQAAFALRLLGYRNVVVLRGGILEWKKRH
jgi:rhodanese-related sulfurtransferase